MSGAAVAFALGAAVLHPLWNALLARAADPRAATAAALAVAVVAYAPAAALGGAIESGAWPYIAASAVLQTAYFLLLSAAYERGELSAVYPVARGAAPVLVLAAGIAGLGGDVSAAQAAGVLIVGAGVVAVGAGAAGATAPALAVAASIAAYTLVDRSGLEHADPLPYLWLVLTPTAVLTIAATVRGRGAAAVRAAFGPAVVAAGLATFGAYCLVLAALERAPAAPVAAVRETSIVLAVALAAATIGERVTPARWGGAVAATAGAALVALG